MSHITVGFIMLDIGIVIGWCMRVGLTRAQSGTRKLPEAGHGFIARW